MAEIILQNNSHLLLGRGQLSTFYVCSASIRSEIHEFYSAEMDLLGTFTFIIGSLEILLFTNLMNNEPILAYVFLATQAQRNGFGHKENSSIQWQVQVYHLC